MHNNPLSKSSLGMVPHFFPSVPLFSLPEEAAVPLSRKLPPDFSAGTPSHKGVFGPWTPAIQRYMSSGLMKT